MALFLGPGLDAESDGIGCQQGRNLMISHVRLNAEGICWHDRGASQDTYGIISKKLVLPLLTLGFAICMRVSELIAGRGHGGRGTG
jgi:hypothetical protein